MLATLPSLFDLKLDEKQQDILTETVKENLSRNYEYYGFNSSFLFPSAIFLHRDKHWNSTLFQS